ncbi:hypothetical protein [Natronobacterium texcoconense]|uniref:DUF1918 domain-containing protein n=1 Tax=Natronobacterium texcoconense TaxID=1095778 RepID=A0A1H0YWK0_NATTX|nr:hypothetical protein [Natronobacterium texcoconense]SDQ19246.1 hypothetical protein SAMN04489842_0025 [Natronobacterium texcoconense]
MEDISSMEVGDIIRNVEGTDTGEYRVVEKETSSVGKIQAIVVEPVDGEGEQDRVTIPQSEWGDTWTA